MNSSEREYIVGDDTDDESNNSKAKASEDALNPHIPQFIARAPWYVTQNESSLEHQRLTIKNTSGDLDTGIKRGVLNETHYKYRKGACTNCGSMTHQARDCLERPRKVGAKWSNLDICPDEIIPDVKKTNNLDEKRDRWKGFVPEDYRPIVEQFEAVEELAKKKRAEKVEELLSKNIDSKTAESEKLDQEKDELKLGDFDETTFGISSDNTRTNVRNLRIREDTAKYLRNLDLNSAFYDPKSRSMREDPFQKSSNIGNIYRGDNAIRNSGDVSKILLMEAFAYNMHKKGESIHLQALPTRSEMLYKSSISNKDNGNLKQLEELSKRYEGNNKSAIPKLDLSERPTTIGDLSVLNTKATKKYVSSIYVEDEYISNHTQVWGSYYDKETQKWGFRCCKQTCRFSKCTNVL
ncbi:putative step II splicing factor SLU7 [Cryptosporidium canis]|uniref:Pre-mRNA-splicing factor SLU7 n=1 Tax=Cryptosporidium canis TaxID=195482 RepID=A0ABQ8PC39_9CRYT|nr:putative step II splicing factor SLU7 [Cryptosporidium canis]KAJ1615469.1 putative step II splicing factor SLU7 [Cryptosporidium canis]